MNNKEHTFVICAYKESAYLEQCIKSLIRQRDVSELIMVTSTPNDLIAKMAREYSIDLYVNKGTSGITQDWEFALSKARTDVVTIAHQDDVYEEDYAHTVLNAIHSANQPLIVFSDYYEIKDGKKVITNRLLRIKRIMLRFFKIPFGTSSRFIRRAILSLGNPICCPSVTYYLPNLERPIFQHHFKSNEDWEAWERMSRAKGEFVYIDKMLMGHRIHEESETSLIIAEDSRSIEDYEMFRKFWPDWIAKIITAKYKKSEQSNSIK